MGDALPLAIAAGFDLPPMVVELMAAPGGVVGKLGEGGIRYRAGIYVRDLRSDLGWFAAAFRGELPAGNPSPWMEIARGKLRLLSGRERPGLEGAGDPGPAWAGLGRTGRRLGSIARRRSLSLLLRAWHLLAGPRPARSGARRILVVCDGNICRSPFAAAILGERLANLGVIVESAGLSAARGHPAPPLARAAAERHGVSLTAHRSRPLAPEMVANADLILVMDLEQERRLLDLDPGAAGKLELLGRHGPGRLDSPEIADPVSGDARTFDRVYARVSSASERVAEGVRASAAGS
jgi:protein-tyrosine phosphatase